ncbi:MULTISPECIES: Ail/Lom family outer membrane beta-barrel protein [unclassified Serratia (in: enterobacteria)]|uniref:Ail/Lom family outer membrane beta-barrel protein n=1 Tax=unclassified Serratia (in: enterobacteria) TaxID=2647522 RepID=UPI002ED64A18|nr:Ail/Lom family outer membrane beta-barrel protein [Serratia sp. C2(2)]MEE4448673.1 Ail/Lom family outer membrane beta-barrel protein [Serratia sp. C2(1)]
MKTLVIASMVISTLGLSAAAHAGQSTLTAGYAQSKVQDFKNINGVNLKYRYEWDSPISVISSFTYMSGDQSESYYVYRDRIDNHAEVKYYSLSVGPAYRINPYISVYGLLGLNYNKVDYKSSWHNYAYNTYEYMGEESGNQKKTSLMYGVGFQVNPIENLAIDVGYEGSRLDADGRNLSINGFNIGVGYRF